MDELITHCLILDLKNDEELIRKYEDYHKKIWPEIEKSIFESGIEKMEIFRAGDRMVMLMTVNETFSFAAKQKADASNPVVQEWEELMLNFQKPLPFAKPGEKWVLTKKIFGISQQKTVNQNR